MSDSASSSGGVRARYHDGLSSRSHDVALRFLPGGRLRLEGEGVGPEEFDRRDVRLEPPLGNAPRFLRLPGERCCEIRDQPALDREWQAWGDACADEVMGRWLHRLERSWRRVLMAAAMLIVIAWAGYTWGVPWAAKQAAYALPESVLNRLSDETMATFDRLIFEPSVLSEARRLEIQEKFSAFLHAAEDSGRYRLEFRAAPSVGANAFALPSGLIVLTDELVALAESDDEILAVLAHEAGHVRHRHILRSVLQNAAVAVAVTLVTGDVSSATAAAAAAPAFLLQNHFSREFEREADTAAVATMRRAGMQPESLARILLRLEAAHREESPDSDSGESAAWSYISSHPPTAERIEAIRESGDE